MLSFMRLWTFYHEARSSMLSLVEDQPTVTESSSNHDSSQNPRVYLEGIGGSGGDQVNLTCDSPLSGGHTSDRAKGSLNLEALYALCTTLSNRVLPLETVKDAQAKEILTLKARITMLEKRTLPNDQLDSFFLKPIEGYQPSVNEAGSINMYEEEEEKVKEPREELRRNWNDLTTLYLEVDEKQLELNHIRNLVLLSMITEEKQIPKLKELPSNLEYAFLNGKPEFLVIISSLLSKQEKMSLLQVLAKHKAALAWKVSHIKGISPLLSKQKILMEDNYTPVVQPQRRLNPKVQDVVKDEIMKLLDARLIYSISDRPWITPIYVVPKKDDENPILTLGDYSKPSHEGYKNTIEILEGNNVVRLRSDTIRGSYDTQYCMENPKQAFVDYASLRIDKAGGIRIQQIEEPKQTLEYEFQDLHLNLPVLEVLTHAPIYNAMLDKYVESLELGSCVKIILLYLFKKLNIELLEETSHIFGLADGTKSYPVGIVKDVEVHIGRLKLLNDFYVIYMEKDPETPLLVGQVFLETANAVIDYRKAKIVVGKGIIRSVFGVKGVDLGEEDAPYWTTLGKRKSYKP
nr:putative reverse transcriptase domain-containing protein [Tanacetum cinerariifolium]